MSKYLSAALYWLGQMNAPVILMSATLPSATRNGLMKSYAKGLKGWSRTEQGNCFCFCAAG